MGSSSPSRTALLAILALCAAATVGLTQTQPNGFEHALQRASESLVQVRATFPVEESPFPLDADKATFWNVGFFVGTEGEVLTSLLGVAGCRHITVTCPEGRSVAARMVAMDQATGLALLRADVQNSVPLEPMPAPPQAGTLALLASGRRRYGGGVTFLQPTLISYRRAPVLLRGVEWHGLIAMAGDLRAGGAAAPLLDREGRLAGVVLGVQSGGDAGECHCLALSADRLAPIISRLKQGKSRRLGWLGLTIVREPGEREGVRVGAVLENSPAHLGGIRPGDVLLQIDDSTIDSPAVFARRLVESEPGTTMSVNLLRGGQMKTVPVKLGQRPLLICGASRRPGEDIVRWRWRRTALFAPGFEAWQRTALRELLEENERLRRHVEELERRPGRLESPTE